MGWAFYVLVFYDFVSMFWPGMVLNQGQLSMLEGQQSMVVFSNDVMSGSIPVSSSSFSNYVMSRSTSVSSSSFSNYVMSGSISVSSCSFSNYGMSGSRSETA